MGIPASKIHKSKFSFDNPTSILLVLFSCQTPMVTFNPTFYEIGEPNVKVSCKRTPRWGTLQEILYNSWFAYYNKPSYNKFKCSNNNNKGKTKRRLIPQSSRI